MYANSDSFECRTCRHNSFDVVTTAMRDWEYGVPGEWSYYRCQNCELVQIHPFPTIEDLVRAYEVDYHGHVESKNKGPVYHLLYQLNEFLLSRSLRKVVPSDASVLDIGCGTGAFLERLGRLGARQLTGIDFSPAAVAQLGDKGIAGFQGTFQEYDAEDRSFDLVIMNNYLEHTIDLPLELKKARRLLVQEGRIWGEVPNFRSMDRWLSGRYWGGNHVPRHTFQFEPKTLRNLMEEAGFREIEISQSINPAHIATSFQNFFQRNRQDLSQNGNLKHGRAWYFGFLILATLPINLLFSLLGVSGFMKFSAKA